MKPISGFLLTVFIVVFPTVTQSQELQQFKARVSVSVTATENIEGSVTSYINTELRALRDVELVSSDPEWELQIVAMEVTLEAGRKVGIVLSVVILAKFSNFLLEGLVSAPNKDWAATANLYDYPDHWLRVGSTEDLRSLCEKIVADFDTKYLEKKRKSHREFMDIIQKSKQSRKEKP